MAAVLLTASIANATASIASCLCSAEAATMTLASLTGTILLWEKGKNKKIKKHSGSFIFTRAAGAWE